MTPENRHISRQQPTSLLRVLFWSGFFVWMGLVINFLLFPKRLDIVIDPPNASVHQFNRQECPTTPCTFFLNRLMPKTLYLQASGYRVQTVKLRALGLGWGAATRDKFVLEPLISEADIQNKIDTCIRDRFEKLGAKPVSAEAEVCHRVPPVMPFNANYSGHCHVVFDVNPEGRTRNIRLNGCTEVMFGPQTVGAVRTWAYLPEIENGEAVFRRDVEAKVIFRLADFDGSRLPEPSEFFDADHIHDIAMEYEPVSEE